MPINRIKSERLKFGQYLIDKGKLNLQTLAQALDYQNKERLSKKPLRLGIILWSKFGIFRDRSELYHFLKDFEKYRDEIEQVYRSLEYYSNLYLEDLESVKDIENDNNI